MEALGAAAKKKAAKKPAGKKAAAKKTAPRGKQVPLVDYLILGKTPYIRANQCKDCGARYFDRRNACANCGGTEFKRARVKGKAKLKAFSIVHHAAPGLPVPYVSAILETEDGTSVRSNLIDIDPDPSQVELGMKVKLRTYVVGRDDDGTEAVAFGYAPI
jgi:uncharacterized OB-fold protein